MSDYLIAQRARLAAKITAEIEADWRVSRCKRIDFANEGGALLAVELLRERDAKSRREIARELELTIAAAVPALPWARVQIVQAMSGGPNL